MGAWDSILNKIKDFGADSDLISQIRADTASKEDRDKAISEKDKLMSDMEFQGRSQHQMAKEFPTYSKAYGNRAIYNPTQDLSGFADQPEVNPILKSIEKDPAFDNLDTQSLHLRNFSEKLSAEALAKDMYKTTDYVQFINELQNKDKLNYNAKLSPNLKRSTGMVGAYGDDPDEPGKKMVIVDSAHKNELETWLHEHLHAKNTGTEKDSPVEKLDSKISNKKRKDAVTSALGEKDINKLRQMISGGHFMEKNNTLPELYVQDEFENKMKDRGFETRKDPIKSRFDRLKQLMRY